MAIVAGVGALTALFAAIIGFAQNDFKKVLAYSTVSQLGFMFVGVGTANFARRHLPPVHARLLQGRPVPVRRLGDARDERLGRHHHHGRPAQEDPLDTRRVLRLLAGDLRHPDLLGLLLEGLDHRRRVRDRDVFGHDLAWVGTAVGVTLMLAALGTAFYMSRLYFLVFSGDETRAPDDIKHHIHESPSVMVVPLVVLAIGAAVGRAASASPAACSTTPSGTCSPTRSSRCSAPSWRSRTRPRSAS